MPKISKVTDPQRQVTDPLLLSALANQGIDFEYVEFTQDYAMPATLSNGQKEKGKSPYAKFYRDLKSNKRFMVSSGLPMVDADGVKIEAGWRVAGINYFTEKNNLFRAKVQGTQVEITVRNDQPDSRKAGDKLTFNPQLFLDGVEQKASIPILLTVDPINSNYSQNVLEWDYGICKRRLRIIEGRIRDRFFVESDPHGEVKVVNNVTGNIPLRFGSIDGRGHRIGRVEGSTEIISAKEFSSATYPITIGASPETFYPDADPESTSVDGDVGEDTNAAWATIRAAAGDYAYDTYATRSLAYFQHSLATADYWAYLARGIYVFNTSGLPDDATITGAILSFFGSSEADGCNASIDVNIYSSAPASNTALAAGDFDSLGTTPYCDTALTIATYSIVGYNDFILNAAGLAAISKTTVSKFGTRDATHDAGGAVPADGGTDTAESYFNAYNAEQGNGYKPKLVVTYITDVVVTPSTLALTLTTYAPTVISGQVVTPSTLALTITTYAPTVTATDNKLVTPSTLALTLTTYAPTIKTKRPEYSACAPLKVMSQSLSSDPSGLLCYLTMTGIPNQMEDDKASKKYNHHKSDTKTVKDMITEVMNGQPVDTELTEEQTETDSYIDLDQTQDDPLDAVGQRVSVPDRLITKVAFRLKKTGSPAGTNVTFVIRQVEAPQTILASKTFAIASISTSPAWCEATLTTPVQVDEEITWAGSTPTGGVWIYCEYTDGTATDYVSVSYNSYGVKANEWGLYVHSVAGADDLGHTDEDCAVRYKYTADGIDCWARGTTPETYCQAYDVVYDPYGTHTGSTHATIMTDSAATFKTDALIGQVIYNTTDGSSGTVTDNNATTVTVTALAGGSDNQWELNDAYTIEDSLLDVYLPKDAFRIQKNDNRLSVINRLLGYTSCVKRFEDDGKMHVFVPTTSGTTYDYEYSLATADHKFFSKSQREALVIPNRYVVSSYENDTDQYTGNATSATSYALLPKSEFVSRKLVSNAQGTAIASALIGQAERAASRGSASVPINVGAEVWDYIKVTDSRQSDSRTGNLGVLRRVSNPTANVWNMPFSFGKGGRKAISGVAPSAFDEVIPEEVVDANAVVRWGALVDWWQERLNWIWYGGKGKEEEVLGIYDLYAFLLKVFPDIEKWLNYYNEVEGAEDVDTSIATALLGYIRRLQDDPDPTLGAALNVNGHNIADTTNGVGLMAGNQAIRLTGGGNLLQLNTDGNLDFNNDVGAINLKDPTSNQDAATKKYVDDNAGGITATTVSMPTRAVDTIYQNTTGNPLLVTVSLDVGDDLSATAEIGSGSPPGTVVASIGYVVGAGSPYLAMTFVVPVSYYYRVSVDAGVTKKYWMEAELK